MFFARSGLGIEDLGNGRVSLHGWSKAFCIALFVFLLLVTLQSARIGVSGLIVELAQGEVDRWASTQSRRTLREVNRVAGFFSDSLGFMPGNPWALERLGALDLARVRLSRAPRDAVAFTQSARLRFRQALQLRPTSPFLWANIARAKLYLDEIDEELFTALRYADVLAPWEPATQQSVLFTGLATWGKLDSGSQQALARVVQRGASRNANKLFDIVKSYRRFDLVCGIQEYNSLAGTECGKAGNTAKSGQRVSKGNR